MTVEVLEPRQLLAGQPVITEFLASNGDSSVDGDGNASDWIELFNAGDTPVDLAGYRLTDSAADLAGWTFPSGTLPNGSLAPGEYRVVYASGQSANDYVDAAGNLHTSFRLSADSGYLALVSPGGEIVSEFGANGAAYPTQYRDIAYGVSQTSLLIDASSEGFYLVPLGDQLGTQWTEVQFDAATHNFFSGPAAVGFESRPNDRTNFSGEILTTLPDRSHAVYARYPFTVTNASDVTTLILRLKYDNGFVAYLNGEKVVTENAPDSPGWFSSAPNNAPSDRDALEFVEFDLSDHTDQLVDGENVLAIHLMNNLSDNSDLLLVPQLIGNLPIGESAVAYLPTPSPGAPNFGVDAVTGPVISEVTRNPGALADQADLVVTANVQPQNAPVGSVSLVYRTMYDDEVTVAMVDDGTGGDAARADGVYTATIPHSASGPGQMLRWRVTARDTHGGTSRAPHGLDQSQTRQSADYYGTVVADPSVNRQLPVLQWFIEPGQERAADQRTGARSSVFFDGELYDNVFVRVRGGSTANIAKKSYKFQFHREHRFQYDPQYERVSEFNLNTTFTNKDYVRQVLTFETFHAAGAPASEASMTRVDRNGEFFSVAVFIEQPDEQLLSREGLDPAGALYKMFNTFTSSTSGVEKQTRQNEDNSDLREFIDNINRLNGDALKNYVFDNVDLPAVSNYLAASVITQNNDQSAKNYYLYRDSEGSGEWLFLPWDLDLTFGLHFMTNDSILDDEIWADKDGFRTFAGVTIWPSHPFFGDQEHPGNRSWNRLIDALYEIPEFRSMYLRRLRTLMDDLLQPPGTPAEELKFEARLDALVAQLGPDVALDYAKWADPWPWGDRYLSMPQAVDQLKQQYLAVRRVHLYQTHSIDNVGQQPDVAGIPHAQVGHPQVVIDATDLDVNPGSGDQDQEYLKLNNLTEAAVDISGWQLRGGVDHTFRPGTVILAGGSLYVSPNAAAFRARQTGPSGGQGLLVQGGYGGHLSNFGETIELVAPDGTVISTMTTPAMPSDVQKYLRITELHYNPPGDDETEFVELRNVSSGPTAAALELTGVTLTDGPSEPFTFPSGWRLEPGQHVLVVKNQAAFQAAYPSVEPGIIAGQFMGSLNNAGERVKLEDASGSTVLDFTYADDWHPQTDGGGFSLVVRDVTGPYDQPDTWRASASVGGSPGTPETLARLPGDANGDGIFDRLDIVSVLQSGKYGTGEPATWAEGDWNEDGIFSQIDLVFALQSGAYASDGFAVTSPRFGVGPGENPGRRSVP